MPGVKPVKEREMLTWSGISLSPEERNRAQVATLRSGVKDRAAEFVAELTSNQFETLAKDLILQFPLTMWFKKGGAGTVASLQRLSQGNKSFYEYMGEAYTLRSEIQPHIEATLVKAWCGGIADQTMREYLLMELKYLQERHFEFSRTLDKVMDYVHLYLDK
ncbi:hypothetical protein N7478_001080 [Penicillium angulare]|uniref:uncharacterized protein n=1 Tax=Penicillium angulare TaxID=116970 RepID=UPI002541ECDE|nr:uncharacterized protein N7478_001080 [Penicillium angulare]KAJ5291829.1 hypothetical protein N7478_001080 [Penicillium angulare]